MRMIVVSHVNIISTVPNDVGPVYAIAPHAAHQSLEEVFDQYYHPKTTATFTPSRTNPLS